MLRHEIISAINRVIAIIQETGLAEVIQTELHRETSKSGSFIAETAIKFVPHIEKFTQNERRILEVFSLSVLVDTSWWTKLLTTSSLSDPKLLFSIFSGLNTLLRYGPRINSLLIREHEPSLSTEKDHNYLVVWLSENSQQISNIERVLAALEGIRDLYSVCATLQHSDSDELALISCDSGSDKELVLKGNANAIEKFKEILISVWNRVVFYREIQASQRIKNIAESLPVLEEISKLEDSGKIARETAEILRRKTVAAATQIMETGIVLPELTDHSAFNPRTLLTPAPKLLAKPTKASENPQDPVPESPEQFESTKQADSLKDALNSLTDAELRALVQRSIGRKKRRKGKGEKNS